MSTHDMDELVRGALHEIAPEADLRGLAPADDLRETLGLDSLDFLQLVEVLSERTGVRIDEDDYPRLDTLAGTVEFLTSAPQRS
ncbi:acyl carrier protein [Krasilnikovia cinnamomea]|uniref:Acyl carrier protein n=1 Tax=Krasilnikovia cinnamomea TaxID=349313 RepID=A0A4Q7ZQX3_9ACTN|nr:acyl carrier protein [Krasilnikovia cinnamomea]RZU53517.1 acyl carrier protein [Krasilnikovia cinnamomea]